MPASDAKTPEAQLRERGLQVTAQRLAVLGAVEVVPHGTADEIADAVRGEIGSISRQGVYDVLGALVDSGLLRRIQPAGSSTRFEGRVGDNHHHMVCRSCGLVADVECSHGAAPCLAVDDDRGFLLDEAEVIHWGLCPDCQR